MIALRAPCPPADSGHHEQARSGPSHSSTEPRSHSCGGNRAGPPPLLRGAEHRRGDGEGRPRPHALLPPLRRSRRPARPREPRGDRRALRGPAGARPRPHRRRPARGAPGDRAAGRRLPAPRPAPARDGRGRGERPAGGRGLPRHAPALRRARRGLAGRAGRHGRGPPREPRRDRARAEPHERGLPARRVRPRAAGVDRNRGADPDRDLGCADLPGRGQRLMDVFRTPDERFADLPGFPYEPHYVDVDGLRLHHVDEGEGPTVLCFHGEPSWSYLYRHMLDGLVAAGRRVVCPDLVGFGRSDKPTDQGWYPSDRHVETVSAHLDQLDLSDVTVIVQDWGGPIGLRWAVEHADRVGGLVILNTGLFSGRVSKGFMAWREFAERTPDLPIGRIIQGATTTDLPDAVVAAYEAPFPTPESKAGAAQFPLLVPLDADTTGAAEMAAVKEALAGWDKPALVAFSDTDPVFPYPAAGEQFTALLPTAGEQIRIEGAAHFLQEDRGARIAGAMLAAFGEPA